MQSLIGILVAETAEPQSKQAPILLLIFLNNADKPVSDKKEVTIKEGGSNLDETVGLTIFPGFNLGRQSAKMEILGFYCQTNPALL